MTVPVTEARFLTPLRIEKIGARRWRLLEPLVFQTVMLSGVLVAPAGFETNFASIPRFAWSLLPPVGTYDWAAVMHDAGYGHALLTEDQQRVHLIKPLSDRLFYEGLRATGVPAALARILYLAVRIAGDQPATVATRAALNLSQGGDLA